MIRECSRAEYFVDRLLRLRAMERLVPLAAVVKPDQARYYREKLGALRHEVRELQPRLGFSVRRAVNAQLVALGLPEIPKPGARA